MSKFRLDFDSLQVESFHTTGIARAVGTVVAHESELTGGWSNCNCSMQASCDPEGYTCACPVENPTAGGDTCQLSICRCIAQSAHCSGSYTCDGVGCNTAQFTCAGGAYTCDTCHIYATC